MIAKNCSQSCSNLRSRELFRKHNECNNPNKKITELEKMLFSIEQRAYSHSDLKNKNKV